MQILSQATVCRNALKTKLRTLDIFLSESNNRRISVASSYSSCGILRGDIEAKVFGYPARKNLRVNVYYFKFDRL